MAPGSSFNQSSSPTRVVIKRQEVASHTRVCHQLHLAVEQPCQFSPDSLPACWLSGFVIEWGQAAWTDVFPCTGGHNAHCLWGAMGKECESCSPRGPTKERLFKTTF